MRIWRILGAALFFLSLWVFLEIAEDYPEGRFLSVDGEILRALRTANDPSIPRGPPWLKDVMRDISAMGSAAVLGITVAAVLGYLALLGRWASAFAILAASIGGTLVNVILKSIAQRPRPDVVPHLAEVTSTSFPSGHSMLSAIIYLSLGVLLARTVAPRKMDVYVIGVASALVVAIGFTRMYLGVHFPSDVVAGWAAGIAWTLLCVAGESLVHYHLRRPSRGPVAT